MLVLCPRLVPILAARGAGVPGGGGSVCPADSVTLGGVGRKVGNARSELA